MSNPSYSNRSYPDFSRPHIFHLFPLSFCFFVLLSLVSFSLSGCQRRGSIYSDPFAAPSASSGQLAALEQPGPPALAIPPLLDTAKGEVELRAQRGNHAFVAGVNSSTMGYNGDYLGPTILLHAGTQARIRVRNELNEGTTLHSHGALIPGAADGGPHKIIPSGKSWQLQFLVQQQAATLWYHPHKVGSTASQIWYGLAGLYIVQDELSEQLPLPRTYGLDDIPVVVQERSLDRQGRMLSYERASRGHMTIMNGISGNRLLVNGQLQPQLTVAAGWLRLRLLNGSNASSYRFSFSADGQRELPFYRIASEQGFLAKPEPRQHLDLSASGRSEVMIQLSGQESAIELKLAIWNSDLSAVSGTRYPIMSIYVDPNAPSATGRLPSQLRPAAKQTAEERRARQLAANSAALQQLPQREFDIQMMMRGSGMGRGFGMMRGYGINDQSFDMQTLNFDVPKSHYELWRFTSDMLGHPMHIHGVQFLILQSAWLPDGSAEWRDTFTVNTGQEALVLLRFDHEADAENPYMLHCHMLEHEEAGMMASFSVS